MLKLVKLYKKYSYKRNKSYIKEDDKCWCYGEKKRSNACVYVWNGWNNSCLMFNKCFYTNKRHQLAWRIGIYGNSIIFNGW